MRDFVVPEIWDKLSVVVRTKGNSKLEVRNSKQIRISNTERAVRGGNARMPSAALSASRHYHPIRCVEYVECGGKRSVTRL
jgi:hypothetical protein